MKRYIANRNEFCLDYSGESVESAGSADPGCDFLCVYIYSPFKWYYFLGIISAGGFAKMNKKTYPNKKQYLKT